MEKIPHFSQLTSQNDYGDQKNNLYDISRHTGWNVI